MSHSCVFTFCYSDLDLDSLVSFPLCLLPVSPDQCQYNIDLMQYKDAIYFYITILYTLAIL